MCEMAEETSGEIGGELRLGIIPTVAPYLLPLFLEGFLAAFPKVKLKVTEMMTEEIVRKIRNYELDAGILATPLGEPKLIEVPLFYEEFVVYASSSESILEKNYVLASDIDPNRLWLLEEGHCLRSQIINLCELRPKESQSQQLEFESGSIETLKRIVEVQQGITVLPRLALRDMPAAKLRNVRAFRKPVPVREIAIVYGRISGKEKLMESLKLSILSALPPDMRKPGKREIVAIDSGTR
jgi:LysR family hydrogen peroxide-inducible transcriptional activator